MLVQVVPDQRNEGESEKCAEEENEETFRKFCFVTVFDSDLSVNSRDVCNVILFGENVEGEGFCFAGSCIGPAWVVMLTGSSFSEARNKACPLLGGGGRESRVTVVYYQISRTEKLSPGITSYHQ